MVRIPGTQYASTPMSTKTGSAAESMESAKAPYVAGEGFAQTMEKVAIREGQSRGAKAFSEFALQQQKKMEQEKLDRTDPSGATDDGMKRYDKDLNDFMKNEKYVWAREYIKDHGDAYRGTVASEYINWEANQKLALQQLNLDETENNYLKLIGDNPNKIRDAISLNGIAVDTAERNLSAVDSKKRRMEFQKKATQLGFSSSFNKNVNSAEQFLKSNEDLMDAADIVKGQEMIKNERERLRKENEAKTRKIANEDLSYMKESFTAGFPMVGAEDKIKFAEANGHPDVAKDMREMVAHQKEVRDFALKPPVEQTKEMQAIVTRLNTGQGTEHDLRNVKFFQNALEQKQEQMSADPVSYQERMGVLRDVPPVDFMMMAVNPAAFQQQMRDRSLAVAVVEQREGYTISPLRAAEADNFKAMYDDAKVKDKASLLSSLAGSLDTNQAQAVAMQLNKKDPALAGIMMLSTQNKEVAERVIIGLDALKQGTVKLKSDDDIQGKFNSYVDGLIPDEQITARKMWQTLAKGFYAADMLDGKDAGFDGALETVIGPKFSAGKQANSVGSFRKADGDFVSEDDWLDAYDSIDNDTLVAAGLGVPHDPFNGHEIVDFDELRKVANIIQRGDGLYALSIAGNPVLNGDGGEYIIDFRKIPQSGFQR